MKITSGVAQELAGAAGCQAAADRPPAPAQEGPACRAQRSRPARGPAAAGHRASARASRWAWLGLAASTALLGCSSVPAPTAWRMEPVFRLQGSASSAAPGYLALARQYEGEGRVALAVDTYRKAAQSAPDNADVQNVVGLALARHGRMEGAITALRRAVAMAPDRAALLNNLAYALLLDGRNEEARAMFRLTLAVDPGHQIASRNLAHLDGQQPAMAAVAPAVAPAGVSAASIAATPAVPAGAPDAAATVRPEPVPERAAAAPTVPIDSSGSAGAAPLPPARMADFSIEILNGNGVGGAATRMRALLHDRGIHARRIANLPPYKIASTQLLYRPGKAEQARWVADRMPVEATVSPAPAGSTLADLRLVIGHDARHSAGCTVLGVCAGAPRNAAVADARLRRL